MNKVKQPQQLDRRYIYLILFIGVMLPLIIPLGFVSEISNLSRQVFNLVETTPPNSVIMISFDYEPSTATELQPMAKALIEHAWRNNQKIIAIALWPQGVQMADQAFKHVLMNHTDKMYGIDYVNLGYKTGGMVTIQAMGRNMQEVFPTDTNGKPFNQITMLNNVQKIRNIGYIASLSAGDPGLKQYIMAAHDMFGVKVTGGTTAVSTPGFLPYVNDLNQLNGLLGGLKGAAEYESLLKLKGTATSGMDAQSIAHILIVVFIILGNIRAWKLKSFKKHKVNQSIS